MQLNGIKVIEAGSNLAGPVAGSFLADLGAEVIKIERPVSGDDARHWEPGIAGTSARFHVINRNKLSVVLDIKDPKDQQELKRLISGADVFLHNMRPGVVESIGLSAPEALLLNPRLIYCGITGFGSKGPWRSWSGFDGLAQAVSSIMAGNGDPDGPPTLVSDAPVDKCTAMSAAIGILAALFDRTNTGKGSVVETSLLETALWWRDNTLAEFAADGVLRPRHGNQSKQVAPYGSFTTADLQVFVGCTTDRLFEKFAKHVGHPEWLLDDRFATNAGRLSHLSTLETAINQVLMTRKADEWVELLGTNGIPIAPILDVPDTFGHPQVEALGVFQSPPDLGIPLVAAPWSINGVRPPIRIGAPRLGEHNDVVLRHDCS